MLPFYRRFEELALVKSCRRPKLKRLYTSFLVVFYALIEEGDDRAHLLNELSGLGQLILPLPGTHFFIVKFEIECIVFL